MQGFINPSTGFCTCVLLTCYEVRCWQVLSGDNGQMSVRLVTWQHHLKCLSASVKHLTPFVFLHPSPACLVSCCLAPTQPHRPICFTPPHCLRLMSTVFSASTHPESDTTSSWSLMHCQYNSTHLNTLAPFNSQQEDR